MIYVMQSCRFELNTKKDNYSIYRPLIKKISILNNIKVSIVPA